MSNKKGEGNGGKGLRRGGGNLKENSDVSYNLFAVILSIDFHRILSGEGKNKI